MEGDGDPVPAVEAKGYLLRRNWILPVIGALTVLIAFTVPFPLEDQPYAWFGAWMGGWTGLLTFIRNGFRFARPVELRATAESLLLVQRGNSREIKVEDIAEIKLVPRPSRHGAVQVELVLRRGSLVLALEAPEATALLQVLGRRRSTFALVIPFGLRFLVSLGIVGIPWTILSLVNGKSPDVGLLVFATVLVITPICAVLAAFAGVLRGKVVIGADGFTVRWLRRRFIPFAAVRDVERHGHDTFVRLFGKPTIRLRAAEAPETREQTFAQGNALGFLMQEAFRRSGQLGSRADIGTHLRRGQRSAREWLTAIDRLVRGGMTGYRSASLTPELLVEIARSPEGAAEERVGAAAALVRIGDDAHRTTVRIAAEACADPTTRAALLALAEANTDEAIEEALRTEVRGGVR